MTQAEFWEAMHAFREESEANRRHLGELARGLAVRIINLFVKKGAQYKDASKLWAMPWDRQESLSDTVRELDALTDAERNEKALDFLNRINHDGRL